MTVLNIVISGYTAAGKTTHSRRLAEDLGLPHHWAAGMLLGALGLDTGDESRLWHRHHEAIRRARASASVDNEVDERLLVLAHETGGVFDARYLPWLLTDTRAIRVWLGSDMPSRSLKCVASLSPERVSLAEAACSIHAKDHGDIEHMASQHGVVFGPDREVFDLILDISPFATRIGGGAEVAEDISNAYKCIRAAICWRLGDGSHLEQLISSSPSWLGQVFSRVPGMESTLRLSGIR